jgi:hypothetical protein
MKKRILLLLCLWTVQLSIAQSGYPKQILLEDDTLVVFKPYQITILNYAKVSLDECMALNKSYINELSLLNQSFVTSQEIESNLKKQMNLLNNTIGEIEFQNNLLEDMNKGLKGKNRRLKLSRYIYGGVALLGGFYIGNKISKFVIL